MKKILKKIYVGLPNHLQEVVFWIEDKFRVNKLSLMPGGLDVIIEYQNENVLGYDKIKYPRRYITEVLKNYIKERGSDFESLQFDEKLRIVIQNVSRVFAGQYIEEHEDYCVVSFTEVWNFKGSNNFPWDNLPEDNWCYNDSTEYSAIPFHKKYINFWKFDYWKCFLQNEYLLLLPSGMYKVERKKIDIPLGNGRLKKMTISEVVFDVAIENSKISQTIRIPYRYGVIPDENLDVEIFGFTNVKELRNYNGTLIKKGGDELLFAVNC